VEWRDLKLALGDASVGSDSNWNWVSSWRVREATSVDPDRDTT